MTFVTATDDMIEALADVGCVPIESSETVSLKASDRYSTPPWLASLIAEGLRGIDCDPFSDPTSSVEASHHIDARLGGDGYVDTWEGESALVNASYSAKFPQLTAERCYEQFLRGHRIFNVCIASIGSNYWDRWVWPVASAVVCLGRLSFPAGVDVFDKKGKLVCPAGKAQSGNRSEIAAVYSGPDVHRVRRLFEHRGRVIVPS